MSIYSPTHVADKVTRWSGYGVEFPANLAAAIEVYEALRYAVVDHTPEFDLSGITPDNAEERIRAYADGLLLSDLGSGQTPLQKAKIRAVEKAAKAVNVAARASVPDIIEQLTETFENHADAYSMAVQKLPKNLTAETLVAAGPDAVAAYGDAQREAASLSSFRDWLWSTNELPGGTSEHENVIDILKPADFNELLGLDAAGSSKPDRTLAVLNPVWVEAVRSDIEFTLQTPRQAIQLRRRLQQEFKELNTPRIQGVATLGGWR